MSRYKDFTGILVKKRASILLPGVTILTLQNEEKSIRVKFGSAGATDLNFGEKIRVGHIGKTLINIRPLSTTYWNKEYRNIDFKGGIVTFSEDRGQAILNAEYPNGYSVDVGYIDEEKKYYVIVLLHENCKAPIIQYSSDERDEMLGDLVKAIGYVVTICR
jgi:hypothetical protein